MAKKKKSFFEDLADKAIEAAKNGVNFAEQGVQSGINNVQKVIKNPVEAYQNAQIPVSTLIPEGPIKTILGALPQQPTTTPKQSFNLLKSLTIDPLGQTGAAVSADIQGKKSVTPSTPLQKFLTGTSDPIKSLSTQSSDLSTFLQNPSVNIGGNKINLPKSNPAVAGVASPLLVGVGAVSTAFPFLPESKAADLAKVASKANTIEDFTKAIFNDKKLLSSVQGIIKDSKNPINSIEDLFKQAKGAQNTAEMAVNETRVSRSLTQPTEVPQTLEQVSTPPASNVNPVVNNPATSLNPLPNIIPDVSNQPVKTDLLKVLGGQTEKERGFITSVKESPNTPQPLKDMVSGSYVPTTDAQLSTHANELIKTDPLQAELLATNPRNAVDVEIGNKLIAHYASIGNFTKANEIASNMAKSGTELGQSVQAFANYDKTTPEGALKFAQQKVQEYNKLNPNKQLKITEEQVKGLFDRAHSIQDMPQGRERNIASNKLMEEINKLIPSTIADKLVTVWKAGLLTSLRTHERNLLGNLIHGGAEIAKDVPATFVDKLLSLRTGQRTLSPTLRGIGSGTKKGLASAKDIITTGFDPEQAVNKFDVKQINWGNNPLEQTLKHYTNTVFRTLSAEDKPFWNSSFARSLFDQAGAAASTAKDQSLIQKLFKNPTAKMLETATKDADVSTFRNRNVLSEAAGGLKRKLGPLGDIIAPFTGVPSAIAGQIVAYSPIGLVKGIAKTGKVLAQNVPDLQREAAQEVGRGVMGTGIFGLGAYLAGKGLLTGQPKDQAEARQWKLEGKKANSVLIGGKWLTINSVGPEAIVTLAGAKAQQELAKGEDASVANYGAGIGKDFLSQTFLQGVQGPLNALTDPARYGQSYVQSQSASIIPNIVKDVAKSGDPYQRETNSIGDALQAGVPVLRNKLLPQRDALGNKMTNDVSGINAFLDVFNSSKIKSSSLIDELQRLNDAGQNSTPSDLKKSQSLATHKVEFSPEELNKLKGESGIAVQAQLNHLITTRAYKDANDEDKAKMIDNAVTKVRKEYKVLNVLDFIQGKAGDKQPEVSAVREIRQPRTRYSDPLDAILYGRQTRATR